MRRKTKIYLVGAQYMPVVICRYLVFGRESAVCELVSSVTPLSSKLFALGARLRIGEDLTLPSSNGTDPISR